MNWSQSLTAWWLQSAVASCGLLLIARLALAGIQQPVHRIRCIECALAAVAAGSLLLACGLDFGWSLALLPPPATVPMRIAVGEHQASDNSDLPREAFPKHSSPAQSPGAEENRAESHSESAPASPAAAEALGPQQRTLPGGFGWWERVGWWELAAAAILVLHGGGLVYSAVEWMLGAYWLRRLRRGAEPAGAQVLQAWEAVTGEDGRVVQLLESPVVSTPLTCGWKRPAVVVPLALARAEAAVLESCLAHEWSHIQRRDLLTWRAVRACQPLLWIQPLYWALSRELLVCQDMLADDRSTRYGQDRVAYSELLLRLARGRRQASWPGALALFDRPSLLHRRIRMLLQPPAPLRAHPRRSLSLALVLAAALGALAVASVRLEAIQAEDAPPPVAAAPAAALAADEPAAAAASELQEVAADELAGVVVDEQGKPLAGVRIDAWHWYPGNETTTDEQGRFHLEGFEPREKVEVLITKEGYSPQHFAQRPTGETGWTITLGQRTYLEGMVVDAEGTPVAGAELRASFGPVQGDGVVISEVPLEGRSRDDGSYRLHVAPGVYDVQVSAGARGVARFSGVAVAADECKPLPIQLQDGVRFEARVIDSETRSPVEGFVLWQWRAPRLFGRSDADGRIVFEGLIPGPTEFNCGGGEEIMHESGARYYGHGPFGRWWSPEATNEWQRYRLEDGGAGFQRNFDNLQFDLEVGMSPVEIVVERGVQITGRVTDPSGKPVAGATVAPAKTGSGNSLTGDTRYSVTTDAEGRYTVVLPASHQARYNLVAHDGAYGQWRNWANGVGEPFQTRPGDVLADMDLQLEMPGIVRGRVVRDGRGVEGLDVRTHAEDKLENRYYDPTVKTGMDGVFELKFVRPGKHFLQVEPFWLNAEQAPHASMLIEVQAGQTVAGMTLHAAPQQ